MQQHAPWPRSPPRTSRRRPGRSATAPSSPPGAPHRPPTGPPSAPGTVARCPADHEGRRVNTGIISNDGERRLVLISGRAHPDLAVAVSESLGSTLVPTTAYDFANGEIYVRFGESIRGADAFVLQSHAAPINQWIMEQLLMVDALKRASAKTITVVAPFYGYARQDKKHRGREPISARLMSDLFKTAGADRLMSVDLHAAQIQGFFDGPVDHLWAMPILVEYVRTRVDTTNVTVVSPDAGRIRVAEQWAAKLGGGPLAFIHKTRDISRPNRTVANRVVGDVEGRSCVLVDDLIDTAGTITGAVRVLMEAGAKDVIVAATHGVLSDPAVDRLMQCGAREVVVTDTLPIPEDRRFPQLTVLSIAPLLARAIREVFDDGSVTSLFDGQA
ncbi:ribose-phosphate diphosphokinase [Cellulomonas sp. WB94]|nr:ribose-phosphate diphosphokinase [Cellulomonas sp. WB94]